MTCYAVYLRAAPDLKSPAREANRPSLCFPRDGYVLCVVNEKYKIRVIRVRNEVLEHSPIIDESYTPERFLDSLIKISERKPATRAVRRLIAEDFPEKAEQIRITVDEDESYRKGMTIEQIADEFKTEPRRIRKLLRKLGMRAPYEDDAIIRKAVKGALKKPELRKILQKGGQP